MKKLLFLFVVCCLVACKFDNTDKQYDTPKAIDASKNIRNWTCVPGEKVGLIHKNFTEEAIIKVYGKENVKREQISLGEGEVSTATVIFPKTDNEIFITWQLDQPFQVISEILIENENAPWGTSQGISIGTTLEELIQINGKDFKFTGFEWDYSGYTNDWQDGRISKKLAVFLEPANPEAVYPDLLGDELFASNHPKAKTAGLKVRSMIIRFE